MSDNTINSNVSLTKFQKKQLKTLEKKNIKLEKKRSRHLSKNAKLDKQIDNRECKIRKIEDKLSKNDTKIASLEFGSLIKEKNNCDTSL